MTTTYSSNNTNHDEYLPQILSANIWNGPSPTPYWNIWNEDPYTLEWSSPFPWDPKYIYTSSECGEEVLKKVNDEIKALLKNSHKPAKYNDVKKALESVVKPYCPKPAETPKPKPEPNVTQAEILDLSGDI